ncbi:MAG: aminotransferase class I/II-fold pyridoxal phosphate-dependent enzyme [Rikenellaceae bacterium]
MNFSPAKRIEEVSEYYFSMKLRQIAQLNAAGRDIISLGIGGPDRPPHDEVIESLCCEARKADNHSYQSYTGIQPLRDAMCDWYKTRYGVAVDSSKEILPLIGSKEGIMHISMAFVNAGDAVLVPNPGYPTYSSVSRLVQAEIIPYELSEERGWMPDFGALESLDAVKGGRVKLMWVNYPNMPTGANATKELYQKLVDFAQRNSIVVVCDNPYSQVLNPTPMSILEIEGAKECCIELNSLSKSLNMAGWRVGMLATNATFVEWILRVKSNVDSGMFKPLQLAAVEALKLGDEWYKELNEVYASRRKVAAKIMQRLGCAYDENQVGLFLWGKVADGVESGEALCDRALDEARVFITPGFIFGSKGARYIRISLCATEQKMEEALERIDKAMI